MTRPPKPLNPEALFALPPRFVLSATALAECPPQQCPEIALIGRSNVGKSSLINALVSKRGLARASVTPGRTQMINFFQLGEALMVVDLPGYGFAKAPKQVVEQWEALVRAYLLHRNALRRTLLLLDARRGVMDSDATMMTLLDEAGVPYQLVLTKADKLSAAALRQVTAATRAYASTRPAAHPEIAVTSAEKRQGIKELRESLAMCARGH